MTNPSISIDQSGRTTPSNIRIFNAMPHPERHVLLDSMTQMLQSFFVAGILNAKTSDTKTIENANDYEPTVKDVVELLDGHLEGN